MFDKNNQQLDLVEDARKMAADNKPTSSNQKLFKRLIGVVDLDTALASEIDILLARAGISS